MFQPRTIQDNKKRWTHFAGLCKSCGLCIHVCPVKCLDFDQKRLTYQGKPSIKIDIEKCIACKQCERICPDSAIKADQKLEVKTENKNIKILCLLLVLFSVLGFSFLVL